MWVSCKLLQGSVRARSRGINPAGFAAGDALSAQHGPRLQPCAGMPSADCPACTQLIAEPATNALMDQAKATPHTWLKLGDACAQELHPQAVSTGP